MVATGVALLHFKDTSNGSRAHGAGRTLAGAKVELVGLFLLETFQSWSAIG